MRISLRCLQEFISLEADAAAIAHRLTLSGLEVEGIFLHGRFEKEGFVLGTIRAMEACSGKEHLQLVRVQTQTHKHLSVICGAAHMRIGQRVILALEGAVWSQGETVEKRRIGPHMSEGVLCSAKELGLGHDHTGLFEPEATPLEDGTDARAYFSAHEDTVLEIGLTPNRGDAASHYGVARELHALYAWPLHAWKSSSPVLVKDIRHTPRVELVDKAACPRYTGMVLSNVRVGRSPAWLLARLEALAIGAVNNVVDITNYAMHMLGQPFHAFDWEKIAGGRIVVRRAGKDLSLRTLDGKERLLAPDDLLICDEKKPLALAGIMGGSDAAIGEDTRHIFLESAYFSSACIRKTASRLGMQTEASFRYARGVDPARTHEALMWLMAMFSEVLGARPSAAMVDVYPSPITACRIPFSLEGLFQLSGVRMLAPEVLAILKGLAIGVEKEAGDRYMAEVPPYRQDVRREADLFEEILRIYGYDKLPEAPDRETRIGRVSSDKQWELAHEASCVLADAGLFEAITSPLTSVHMQALVSSEGDRIAVQHPASKLQEVLRQSMIPSALEVLSYNLSHRQRGLCFFEHGKVYKKGQGESYEERPCLALYMCGEKDGHTWKEEKKKSLGFLDMMSVLERLFHHFGLSLPRSEALEDARYAYGWRWGEGGLVCGGVLSEALVSAMGVGSSVYYAELDWEAFLGLMAACSRVRYRTISPFPEVSRDLSLVLDSDVPYTRIEEAMEGFGTRHGVVIKKMYLSSVYSGQGLGEGKKSYALTFILSAKKTLRDAQIHAVMDALMRWFEQNLGAIIRKKEA